MHTRGVILANLGSPDDCDIRSVRRFLNEFLMDPFVLPVPWLVRRWIVSVFILPIRAKHTTKAYQSIWHTATGSPLIHHSTQLARSVQKHTTARITVGMRYGNPGIKDAVNALEELGNLDEIFLIPLYPQHADSTRTTTIEHARTLTNIPIRVMPAFYNQVTYLDALAKHIANTHESGEHILFSYHGLPESHLRKADPTNTHCLNSDDCCERTSPAHATCYRHQCLSTTKELVTRLGVDQYTVSFQSRRGKQPWLQPYTDEVLQALPGQGVTDLAVVCPAFVADNLETLEEMGIRGRETFLRAGGKNFRLTPCLNENDNWVKSISQWCENPPPQCASPEIS